ncbi:hypothetical protein R1sor_011984 [Riccia sorocarpa]|uniref:Uncharacterized protein n=1 Tax=Riccia sorocarpa TaxID=122646 RepID=A0ABD3I2I5_9MARC
MIDTGRYQISLGDHDIAASASSSPRRRGGSLVSSPTRQHRHSFVHYGPYYTACAEDEDDDFSLGGNRLTAEEEEEEGIKPQSSLIVLSFQYKLQEGLAGRWLEEYNSRNGRKLKWIRTLPNYLHLVEIDEDNPDFVLDQLLEESPLESLGIFASVNQFHPSFLTEKPKFLRQIVTILISNQALFNQMVFNLADLILAPVGKVVGKQFRKYKKSTRVEAVVETCRETFVTEIEVPLLDTQTLVLELHYVGLSSDTQSRSLLDRAKDCLNSLKPKKGLKPTPPCGTLACFRREKAYISTDR